MPAGLYNFVIEQGTTLQFRIDYRDEDGTPINLEGYHAQMQIRNEPGGTRLYATLSSSLAPDGTGLNLTPYVNGSSLPQSSGSIEVVLSAYSSSLLNFDKAYYDLELISGSGTNVYVSRLLQGKIKLSKEVTKT